MHKKENRLQQGNLFLFILGRNIDLSICEIKLYLITRNLDFNFEDLIESALLIKIIGNFNPVKAADELAGTIKIGRIYLESDENSIQEKLDENNFYIEDSNKINYAFNFFGKKINENFFKDFFKRTYKSMKQKAFLRNIPPHSLAKSIKSQEFIDLLVFKSKRYFLGRTLGVHDIAENKKRYERRPFVDESIGTSVRIARILVNLSGLHKNQTLLDPFCGIGTIIQEALLIGYNAKGIEFNTQRTTQCQKNLEWLFNTYKFKPKFEVFQGDARKLADLIPQNSIDAVVTEPELGPLLKELPNFQTAKNIINELEPLFLDAFNQISRVLKPNGRMVIILPRIRTNQNKVAGLNIQNLLNVGKFKIYNPFEGEEINFGIKIPIVYHESWHKIERLLYIFDKIS